MLQHLQHCSNLVTWLLTSKLEMILPYENTMNSVSQILTDDGIYGDVWESLDCDGPFHDILHVCSMKLMRLTEGGTALQLYDTVISLKGVKWCNITLHYIINHYYYYDTEPRIMNVITTLIRSCLHVREESKCDISEHPWLKKARYCNMKE